MKKLFMAVIALMMTISTSAQFYIYFSDGTVAKVDSISMIAPHESVDLGLSVKWATCNIGANKPEEFGDYFAWGEVEPKEEYNWHIVKCLNIIRKTTSHSMISITTAVRHTSTPSLISTIRNMKNIQGIIWQHILQIGR